MPPSRRKALPGADRSFRNTSGALAHAEATQALMGGDTSWNHLLATAFDSQHRVADPGIPDGLSPTKPRDFSPLSKCSDHSAAQFGAADDTGTN